MWDRLIGKRLWPWRRRFLDQFCRLVLPSSGSGLPSPAEARTVDGIESYVAGLHPPLRLGILAMFDGLNLLAIFFGYLRPMSWLSDRTATAFLHRLERHPTYLIRNLLTGVKVIAMTVYYADPSIERLTGYADDCIDDASTSGKAAA